jgi:Alpha-glutamyl/putrescinyl thymine pyrophosphorylase clade 3
MPTFCRHNRFLERCPICSKTLPGATPAGGGRRAATSTSKPTRRSGEGTRRRGARAESVRVRREGRAEEDGYSSPLIPGVRATADARRLAQEISFASDRLLTLELEPPGLYGEALTLAASDPERASWTCFLIAYLSPLEDEEDPFIGIRKVLAQAPTLTPDGSMPTLEDIPLGPRSSHDPARGADTLLAYRQWVQRTGGEQGTQAQALIGDAAWGPERRFERLFERLALPGLGRTGRYELLVTLGRLGLYELQANSLHLSGPGALGGGDETTVAAKRIFGIGDPLLLDRRAAALAEAVSVPIEALDLALSNWGSPERATVGVAPQGGKDGALEQAEAALGL